MDPGSDDFIDYVNDGDPQPLHPDFGGTLDDEISIYGFPYIVVDGAQAKKTVQFDEAEESDGVDHTTETSFPFYPIPDEAITQPHWIEGGAPGNVDQTCCQDRHMLILDRDNRHLYELYNVWFDGAGVAGLFGRVLRHEDERPPARGMDIRRRGRARDRPRASCATTRCTGRTSTRSATRSASRCGTRRATSTRPRTRRASRILRRCRWARGCG